MAVYHVLKDGTKLNDISGHIVRVSDVPAIYDLIKTMNQKRGILIQRKENKP